ncbi:glycosyltransferase [Clostridium saccharoperbutylacetonicum]|uniref:glycosyltransferase n=1 Tax=Clostridium saccharoperbutylacetonicum TaxID=36745 RepID=UPI0009840771|nr:glycosyltransferase [Clostridium saccharoperbutylacetonicum]AQR97764.1 glycosyltransferase Gtf1 [Clostridium saccharoperbutylacetonicum]NSB33652.1 glycosyltransferase involved in cell wall biosynthesis [Clostridium saccharoperbutylacetonicum]
MNDCLVMLTKVFPFDKGEEFIEDEILMLSENFKKVIIIATSTADSAVQTRTTPENFEILRIKASKIKRSLPINAIKLFPFSNYNGYISEKERMEIKASLKKRAYLTYFISKSNAVFEEAKDILNQCNLSQYNKVIFYSYWFYDTALAAIKLKDYFKLNKKAAISRAHGYDIYTYRNSMNYLPLREYLLKNIDKVYTCSKNGMDYLKNLYNGYNNKIEVGYLGSKDHGIKSVDEEHVFHIVSCCHISPVKRMDLLAKALATLKDSGLKLRWTHFGAGDGLGDLKAYASENLGFMDVSFPGGIKNIDLMKYYQKEPVDLFINTSSSEGLPVSIMEACSFGIPTIATNVGGTSEIVRDMNTGILIDADFKVEELGKKIKYMVLLNNEERQAFRERCRNLWVESFCAERNFARFAQQIKEIK